MAFVSQRGPLYIWVYGGPDPGLTVHKEAHSFLSDICLFRWHPTKKGKLVFGHTDGSLSIFQPGMNRHVRVKQFYQLIKSLIKILTLASFEMQYINCQEESYTMCLTITCVVATESNQTLSLVAHLIVL